MIYYNWVDMKYTQFWVNTVHRMENIMENTGKLPLSRLIENFKMEVIYEPKALDEVYVTTSDVSRPGLQLVGYCEFFDNRRIQIMGKAEFTYLEQFTTQERKSRLEGFFKLGFPALIITRGLQIFPEMSDFAEKYDVPLLRCEYGTSRYMSMIIRYLSEQLAPRKTRHGVLCEIYGEGILIMGESGVGKSEAAIDLVKRGHRLVSDDVVEIKKVSDETLVGTAPDITRHFIELRGIGIINASRIFGAGAVKLTEKIDLVIKMEPWDANKVYDRMGLEKQTTEILELQIPSLTIPVKPGRNLAVIIEVAAMNNRQKKMGYNAAEDLLKKLGMTEEI